MRKKLAIFGGLATLIAVAAVVAWISTASAITTAQKLTFVAPDTERQNVDLKPQGPSIGDLFVFAGPLNNTSGDEAGRLDGHCVTTSVPSDDPETHRRQCFVTATIGTENGETEIELQGVGRILAEDVLLGVSGGTGRFQNARGQALLDFTTPGQVSLRFALIP